MGCQGEAILTINTDGSGNYVFGITYAVQFTSVQGNTAYGFNNSGAIIVLSPCGNNIPADGTITATLTQNGDLQVNDVLMCPSTQQC